jgi:lipopolysaccharide assembly outer membrane protein LptD (OstA)
MKTQMFGRMILSFVVLSTSLGRAAADVPADGMIEITADDSMGSGGNLEIFNKNVVVSSQAYTLSADHVVINMLTHELLATGNVMVLDRRNKNKVIGTEITIPDCRAALPVYRSPAGRGEQYNGPRA